ncbi:MAG: GreA/GreB family elongation factor [Firmicutes bacterium]|nr:GreA/GreB family elongation factor [Bacillota bacterium]
MKTQSLLADGLKEELIRHLVQVEENGDSFIEDFFPSPSPEREEVKVTLKQYIKKIEDLLTTSSLSGAEREFPFVIIGCKVEVKDLVSDETLVFKIISPLGEMPGEHGISPLSPVGKALLLQEKGAQVSVDAPGGTFHYQITSITYSKTP